MARPLITFLSDFGPDGAAAICRGVMLGIVPDAQIVDISHSVRKYGIRDGAYLLWTALPWMPVGTHLAVVDPGVGTARRAIGLRSGRGDHLVGPDNGLLVAAAEALGGIVEVRVLENPSYLLPGMSHTFHGRDVFAPAAAYLAAGRPFAAVGPAIDRGELVELEPLSAVVTARALETAIVYVDSFGNLRLGGGRAELSAAVGTLEQGSRLAVTFGAPGPEALRETATWSTSFGQVAAGDALLYEDSSGRLAFADNQGDAARRLGVAPGVRVRVEPA